MLKSRKLSKLQPIRVFIVQTKHPIRSQEKSKFWRVINERALIGPKKSREKRVLSRKSQLHRFSNRDIQYKSFQLLSEFIFLEIVGKLYKLS